MVVVAAAAIYSGRQTSTIQPSNLHYIFSTTNGWSPHQRPTTMDHGPPQLLGRRPPDSCPASYLAPRRPRRNRLRRVADSAASQPGCPLRLAEGALARCQNHLLRALALRMRPPAVPGGLL